MARRVTGGKNLGRVLRSQARKARRIGREVGWEGRDRALRALRQEHGAQTADGQVTPATHFLSSAIQGAQRDVASAVRTGVASGNLEGGMQRGAEVLRSAIRSSIEDADVKRTGDLKRSVSIRRTREI